jgi:hypothetical protein
MFRHACPSAFEGIVSKQVTSRTSPPVCAAITPAVWASIGAAIAPAAIVGSRM